MTRTRTKRRRRRRRRWRRTDLAIFSRTEDLESEEVAMAGGGGGVEVLAREVSESMGG